MKRLIILLLVLVAVAAAGQQPHRGAATVVILPFENASKAPGIEWIGEAFPEVLGQRLQSASLFVVSRDDRLYAFERFGIPAHLRPSRATLYRIAEQMDADYVLLGSYTFDGQEFGASAQLLDMRALKLSTDFRESGPLVNLLQVINAVAWDALRSLNPQFATPRERFLAAAPTVRLDAFENYIRGVTAQSRADKIRYFREAARLNPHYTQAIFELGRQYFRGREFESAVNQFSKISASDPISREARFLSGIAYYNLGDLDRAQAAFQELADQMPLLEVFNNLGVVESRRGRRTAIDHFSKVVQADPNDADYRFNFALALYRAGDSAGAAREAREALRQRPNDLDARMLADLASVPRATDPAVPKPVPPPFRIKRNYDENSFRQLAMEIQNAQELRLAGADPKTHAAFHVDRGRELMTQGFSTEAETEYREAILLDPTSAAAHAGLAQLLENANDSEGARSHARTSLRLQPSAAAYLVLANLAVKDKNHVAANENVDRALALEPTNAAAQALKRSLAAQTQQP